MDLGVGIGASVMKDRELVVQVRGLAECGQDQRAGPERAEHYVEVAAGDAAHSLLGHHDIARMGGHRRVDLRRRVVQAIPAGWCGCGLATHSSNRIESRSLGPAPVVTAAFPRLPWRLLRRRPHDRR